MPIPLAKHRQVTFKGCHSTIHRSRKLHQVSPSTPADPAAKKTTVPKLKRNGATDQLKDATTSDHLCPRHRPWTGKENAKHKPKPKLATPRTATPQRETESTTQRKAVSAPTPAHHRPDPASAGHPCQATQADIPPPVRLRTSCPSLRQATQPARYRRTLVLRAVQAASAPTSGATNHHHSGTCAASLNNEKCSARSAV